ncbi:hypothetical protein L1049_028479 [Liquidambar formosana]|uniref:Exopolygalacturonase n=1 Tax=Liquidambar formosana TaxID=63359 RepID=A0AAP0RK98_LIQFO
MLMLLLVWITKVRGQTKFFNVMKYGAVPDGKTDNRVLRASTDPSSLNTDHWISFRHVDGLTLTGGGSFDGQDSPNTDEIHIGRSSDIQIFDSTIAIEDDYISMSHRSKNINITKVHCGPGHGISIGSLGKLPNEEPVLGITARNCTFSGTSNGVRIKTWAPSASPSIVSNITFQDIIMDNVYNPIIIDQQYCPLHNCAKKAASRVQISDVKFRNIRGTSSSKVAVNLQCSSSVPCEKIELMDINLAYKGSDGPVDSSCSHVSGVSYGEQMPPSCI